MGGDETRSDLYSFRPGLGFGLVAVQFALASVTR